MAVTIKAEFDGDNAKKGLEDLGKASEKAGDAASDASKDTAQSAKDVKAASEGATKATTELTDAEKKAGAAAEEAGQKGAAAKKEQAAAERSAADAARETGKAQADSAAATEVHKLRVGELAKSIGEGLSQAVETFKATGDLGDAASKFAEKLGQGVSQFQPIVGIAIQAASHIGKMAWDMGNFAQNAKDAAASQERAKAAAEGWAAATAQAASVRIGEDTLKAYEETQKRIADNERSLIELRNQRNARNKELAEASKQEVSALGTLVPHTEEQKKKIAAITAEVEALNKQIGETEQASGALNTNLQTYERNLEASRSKAVEERKKAHDKAMFQANDEAQARKQIQDAEKEGVKALDSLIDRQKKHNEELAATKATNAEHEQNIQWALQQGLRRLQEMEAARDAKKKEALDKEKTDAEEATKRQEAVKDEIERINGLGKESNMTRSEAQKILEKNQDLLTKGVHDQKETNRLLKEMEQAKQRILELDKEDQRVKEETEARTAKADADAKRRMDEFKKTQEGQAAWAQAGSFDAVAARIAQDTGRKKGTVQQMLRRGDISQEDIQKAQEENFGRAWGRAAVTGEKTLDLVGGQGQMNAAFMGRQDVMEQKIAQLDAQQKAMIGAAQAREANTRRRLNGR